MTSTLSVIIVSYNVKHYLWQCLDSVWRSARFAQMKVDVWVVDNASKDETVSFLRETFPEQCSLSNTNEQLHIIANQRNVGFGRANNQALKQCKGEFVLFLNPDTIVSERTFSDCWKEASTTPLLGAMGVQMLHTNGRMAYESRRGLPTPWTAFCRMSGLGALFPHSRRFGHYYMRYLDEEQAHNIEIVSGAFMWCSRAALEECGGFDEQFFMYGEDIDLSYRFLLAGYTNRYKPSPILHYKGESTQKNTYRYVHVFYQAMLIFFRKHFPLSARILILPVYFAIVLQALLTLVKQQLKAWKRYLSPKIVHTPPKVCYVGEPHTHLPLKEQQNAWGLDIDCYTELPTSYQADILAFSTSHHTYTQVLEALKHSDHRSHLGLYFPKEHILILGNDVFT